ncbi:MAG: hypothetical protein GX868_13055 [Actinobacteria bacterium]|nr:hypothetical protein [Actinomycetota bacterium]
MSRTKLIVLGALAAPIVLYLALLGAWALWGTADEGDVASSVVLAGTDISGKPRDELASSVAELASSFAATPIAIDIDSATLDTTAGALGLSVDTERTTAAALRVGHDDPLAIGPIRWVKSWFSDRHVAVVLDVDRTKAEAELASLEGDHRSDPVEPAMTLKDDAFALVEGVDGKALSLDELLDRLPNAVDSIGSTIEVALDQRVTEPTIADEAVQAVVDQANRVLAATVTVHLGDHSVGLEGNNLRSGLSMSLSGDTPTLVLDEEAAALQIVANLPVPLNPTGVSFDIVNGVPTPVPGHDAEVCCSADAPAKLIEAFLAGDDEITVTPKVMTAAEGVEWAKTLGVKEVIGEFTTNYPCCQSRVTNIKRMSELTRGVLIAPGEVFSANDHVGRRTVEKGFVEGGVIEQGVMAKDIGGGVSQWATTTFNAAFFAGLDIVAHKPHSLYISRYPYGREATLSYPGVDLKIKNNTPYGVVIWPMARDNGITVQMWSTRWVSGAQTAISRTSGCGADGNVTVTRTRTYVDGHTDTDTFSHRYNCEQPTPPKAPRSAAPPAPAPTTPAAATPPAPTPAQ